MEWSSQSCSGAIHVPILPLLLFSGPGKTAATLSVQDSIATRSILLQDSLVSVTSASLTKLETSNHALYLTLALNGGTNTLIANYSSSSSPIAGSSQYESTCAATTATSKVLLSNSVDSITQCVGVSNNGIIVLEDPFTWNSTSISASLLTVPGRYQAELLTASGLVVQPILTAQTLLNIACGQCSSSGCPLPGSVLWNIGGTDAQQFSWSSAYCTGALVSKIYPRVLFSGSGSTTATANFTIATTAYNDVVMSPQNVAISAASDSTSLLSLSTDNLHQLLVVNQLSQTSQLQLTQLVGTYTVNSGPALTTCQKYSSSSAVLVSTGVSNSTLQLCLSVVGQTLSVVDSLAWSNIFVEADALTIPTRYLLNLVGSNSVVFFPDMASTSLVTVTCGQATTSSPAAWNIQNYSPSTALPSANLTSTAASCSLSLGGVVLPEVLYAGAGSTIAQLNLLIDNVAQRSLNFSAGSFNITSDNTQSPIVILTDTVHDLQVMVNGTQGQNTLVLGYQESQTYPLNTPSILTACTSATQSSSSSPSVTVANSGDNATYCFISASGSIVVSDASILDHAIITGNTWHAPQRYRVDLINWEGVYINPPVTTSSMIEVQCGIPNNGQTVPYWHMGMNQISNVTWQGIACQGVITNLFPTYNFTGEGSTNIFADLETESPEDVVVRRITAAPNSLRVEILPNTANVSIYSTHPISVALSMTGGANSLLSTYPISSNNVSSANSSGCVVGSGSSAALFFSNMIDANTYCMVANDGLIFVEDVDQWAETIINSSTLTVPFRYNVELLEWEGVYFLAFNNDSVVNVYCNEPNVTNALSWRIGTNTTALAGDELEGAIVWRSSSCSGVATNLFPKLIFSGNGTSDVTLLVDQSYVPSSVTLNTLSLRSEAPYAYLATDGIQVINLNITVVEATEIVLDRDPTLLIVPTLYSDTTTKISSLRSSSVTLSGNLKFHVKTSTITSNPSVSFPLLLFLFLLFLLSSIFFHAK